MYTIIPTIHAMIIYSLPTDGISVNTSTFSNIVPSQPVGTVTGNASSNTTTGEMGVAAIAVPVSIVTAALALATLAGLVLTVYRLKRRKKIKNKM